MATVFFQEHIEKILVSYGRPEICMQNGQYTAIFVYSTYSYNMESPREMSVPIYGICTKKRSIRLEAIVIKKSDHTGFQVYIYIYIH